MPVQLGTAPDSWGVWHAKDDRQTPWHRFLDEAAQAGYTRIELGPFGYLPTDPGDLRGELGRRGLTLAGGTFGGALHRPEALAGLEEQVRTIGDLVGELGGGYLVLLPPGYRDGSGALSDVRNLDGDDWQRFVDASNHLGRLAREHSAGQLHVIFHPHADSQVEYAAQVERYLDATDPSVVGLCLDTGHYAYRDGDNVDLMRRRHDRISYLHIKSMNPGILHEVHERDLSFSEAVQMGVCAEPDQGSVDFVGLKQVLDEIGFDGYAIVEHDLYPCAFDVPLPIATRTRAYLREIAFG
jgi:inosose dehydratase